MTYSKASKYIEFENEHLLSISKIKNSRIPMLEKQRAKEDEFTLWKEKVRGLMDADGYKHWLVFIEKKQKNRTSK